MADTLDLDDIQGLIIRGYGHLRAACYVMLEIADLHPARRWLYTASSDFTNGRARPVGTALNVAFTYSGIVKLGLKPTATTIFSNEFIEGMATPHRSRILGDVGASSPENWAWGGPTGRPVDLVLMIFAVNDHELAAAYGSHARACAANGLSEILRLDTFDLGDQEHFGFHDGISQPVLEGSLRTDIPMNTIRAGEIVLGYLNEYGLVTDRPIVSAAADPAGLLPRDRGDTGNADLGRNGSYLVFRQLRQDVLGFWQFVDTATRHPDGTGNPDARLKLAAQLVGRWPGGAPLVEAPDRDDPRLSTANNFTYFQADPFGLACPVGAHVRRANPRDSLDPTPGSERSIAVGKLHRIVRRGREYGPPLDPFDPSNRLRDGSAVIDETDRGLHFICFNANILRQFEFIQHTWLNNPHFDGLYDDTDPIIGDHTSGGATFTIQAKPVRKRYNALPRFVSVVGGAYFFMPSLSAIRYLASL